MSLSQVCVPLIQLASMNVFAHMFFIPYDNWETLFFLYIYRYPEVWHNRHVGVFFETNLLKEVSILYTLAP